MKKLINYKFNHLTFASTLLNEFSLICSNLNKNSFNSNKPVKKLDFAICTSYKKDSLILIKKLKFNNSYEKNVLSNIKNINTSDTCITSETDTTINSVE